ncbi:hypothetical protein DPO11_21530 [Salmonella enterica]|nr:hypothetical protein [Salmonella enterica]
MSWLATAKKRKNFPRTVSSEMDWLTGEGRLKGHHAGLRIKLEYIYASCQKDISGQAVYFRFTRVMEILNNADWKGYLLTPAKWKILKRETFGDYENLIFMDERSKNSFDLNGRLICVLKLRICGDIKIAAKIFDNYLPVRTEYQDEGRYYFYLQPEPVSGKEAQ